MKARPILFSGEMVRAILDGRKTQTRRVIKPQPSGMLEWVKSKIYVACSSDSSFRRAMRPHCPYGKVGDVLWVRETFCKLSHGSNADDNHHDIKFRADSEINVKWKPSIFMPKKLSRITLEITDIRVERLQDISEDDAMDEGVDFFKSGDSFEGDLSYYFKDYLCKGIEVDDDGEIIHYNNTFEDDSISSFQSLWQSINGNWDDNPWVWVVEFKPHFENINDYLQPAIETMDEMEYLEGML